jgi:hypothetical protein
MTTTRVQLSSLKIGKRHRAINKHKVEAFARSMGAIGPIDAEIAIVTAHLRKLADKRAPKANGANQKDSARAE